MRVRLIVYGFDGFQAANNHSVYGEMEALRRTDGIDGVDVRWLQGDALYGDCYRRELITAISDGVDMLVEVEGRCSWTPGHLADLAVRCRRFGAAVRAGNDGRPIIQIRPTTEPAAWFDLEADASLVVDSQQRIAARVEREELLWSRDAPHVLLATDRPGWSFQRHAEQIADRFGSDYEIKIRPSWAVRGACDLLVLFWWAELYKTLAWIEPKKIVLCVREEISFRRPEDAARIVHYSARAEMIVAVTQRIAGQLRDIGVTVPIVVCESGVDLETFLPAPPPVEFTVGWVGDSRAAEAFGAEDLKGVGLIREACAMTGARFLPLDAASGKIIRPEEMPAWYGQISAYACASESEGAPNPCLEAMACGRPVISTAVGLMPEVLANGGGRIVERTASSLACAIMELMDSQTVYDEEAKAARAAAEERPWSKVIEPWRDVLKIAEAKGPRKRKSAGRRSMLCLYDQPGWAYENGHRDMAEYLSAGWDFDFHGIARWPDDPLPSLDDYTRIFSPYLHWRCASSLPMERTVGAMRSSTPEGGPTATADEINAYLALQVARRQVWEAVAADCPRAQYLPNPVNMRKFPEQTKVKGAVVVWAGNPYRKVNHNPTSESVKGLDEYIRPACQMADVELVTQLYTDDPSLRIPHSQMVKFYHRGSILLLPSIFEGCSKTLLEAMASGLAVVCTAVGEAANIRESQLEHLGDAGIIIVHRDVDEIAGVIRDLSLHPDRIAEMGQLNRHEAAARWSWDVWADRYADFFEGTL